MSLSQRQRFAVSVNNRVFYGWPMVAVAALGLFASGPGQSHTFSVFNGPIGDELGISATSVAIAYAIATVAAAFMLPVMGRQVDRFGARFSLIGIISALGLACMFFGAAAFGCQTLRQPINHAAYHLLAFVVSHILGCI